MTHRALGAAGALAGLLILGACASGSPAAGAAEDLTGREWIAREIDGQVVMDNAQSTLLFESTDRIVGDTACNRYFGSWEVDGERITLGPLGSTRRACAPEVMDQESRFLSALEQAATWALDADGCLYLSDADGAVLVRLCRAGGM
ncbi:MAG: META domain-containing protein [Rhodospirillales bacterium]|nr:MAG: META domain-containing protein [Rhodospirillales bacterium]